MKRNMRKVKDIGEKRKTGRQGTGMQVIGVEMMRAGEEVREVKDDVWPSKGGGGTAIHPLTQRNP